ncbi:hypothetical protein SB759_35290, partial [Pseudomonas sp. SIMBA_059]
MTGTHSLELSDNQSEHSHVSAAVDNRVPIDSKTFRKIVLASVTGTALEWYDFFLYSTAAALIFGELFFPKGTDPLVGTIAALAGFAL